MRSENVMDAIGLRTDDRLLVATSRGEETESLSWLLSHDRVQVAGRSSRLRKALLEGQNFERVFLTEDMLSDEENLVMALQVLAPRGVLAVEGSEGARRAVDAWVGANYPLANRWAVATSEGELFMTDARGLPW